MKKTRKIIIGVSSLIIFFIPLACLAGWNISSVSGFGLPTGTISKIIGNVMLWILGIIGFIAIIGFAISGIQYVTASGQEDLMETAKRNMTYCIIGVVVALSAFVVLQAVNTMLGGGSGF